MSGAVGSFPSLREIRRKAVRGPVNPMDKSTVVSIYPKQIDFRNITLTPGKWSIDAGSVEFPAILVVGSSSWFKDTHPDEELIEIPVGSVQVAESLVRDYCGLLFGSGADANPGLFFVPGDFSAKEIKSEHKMLLEQAVRRQGNYWRSLIKYADSLWARANGNPLAINEEMRLAAKTLGVQDRDWMKDHANMGQVRCFACGEFKNPEFPICKSCHTIDPEHPKAHLVQKAATTNLPEMK